MRFNDLCNSRPGPDGFAIFGAGAFGREVAWLAEQCWGDTVAITFLVDIDELVGAIRNGIRVRHLNEFAARCPNTPVTIAIADPKARQLCVEKCALAGLKFLSLVHPRVEASSSVSIGIGTVICAGSILTTNISIGNHVHLNVACTIVHDVTIEDYVTFSPGVHVSGNVIIKRGAFLGSGAVVINGSADRPLVIGEGAVIGAGACVIRDVEPHSTVVGVPASRRG